MRLHVRLHAAGVALERRKRMNVRCSALRRGRTRRLALLGALSLLVLSIPLLLAAPVGAAALTGGFGPTIVNGGADLNGDGAVTGSDDANEFYGSTHIIDGKLDCDAWGVFANDGGGGDGSITGADDCKLVGYDGTPDGVTINVQNGVFQVGNGPLPTVFNEAQPNNPDVGDSDFAWSAIDGRVDSNGNESISSADCHFGIVGEANDVGLGDATDGADILGNDGSNNCGFATPPNTADNGLVDLNDDSDITAADSCSNGCFFGHDVSFGKVQQIECPGFEGDPRNDVVGTPAPDTLAGTGAADIICGLGGGDTLLGRGGADLILGGGGADVASGGRGNDRLFGNRGNDRLFGNRGNDRLFGNRGNDFLNGGRGVDICRGGPGRDTRVNCP
jgi:Ca2+-binding RTX toxin-like protein